MHHLLYWCSISMYGCVFLRFTRAAIPGIIGLPSSVYFLTDCFPCLLPTPSGPIRFLTLPHFLPHRFPEALALSLPLYTYLVFRFSHIYYFYFCALISLDLCVLA